MKINQFALYRVNKMTAGRKLWHLSYNEVREQNLAVRVEFYRHMMIGEMSRMKLLMISGNRSGIKQKSVMCWCLTMKEKSPAFI